MLVKHIESGFVKITHIIEGADIKKVMENIGVSEYSIIDSAPGDCSYIDAWVDVDGEIKIDASKAKEDALARVRIKRNELFKDLDRRYDNAVRDEEDLTDLKTERQALKDCTNPLKAIYPEGATISIEQASSELLPLEDI